MTNPMKRCTKCGEEFPSTPEYFHLDSSKKDGFYPRCIVCRIGMTKLQKETRDAKRRAIKLGEDNWYYEAHREEIEAERIIFHQSVIDRKKRERSAYNQAHPEIHKVRLVVKREAQRSHRRCNPRRYIDYQNNYRHEHQDEIRKAARRWSARRRARKLNAEGSYNQSDVTLQYESQHGRCWWCQCELSSSYEIDHFIPLARGGTNYPNNIVLSCKKCNRSRGKKLPHEWSDRLL